jgi:hypothetical protein
MMDFRRCWRFFLKKKKNLFTVIFFVLDQLFLLSDLRRSRTKEELSSSSFIMWNLLCYGVLCVGSVVWVV